MSTGLLVLINALWAVTLWLALPWMLRVLLASRVAGLQLAVTRAVLFGLPVIAVLACTGDAHRAPWLVWNAPHPPAPSTAMDAGGVPPLPAATALPVRRASPGEASPTGTAPFVHPGSDPPRTPAALPLIATPDPAPDPADAVPPPATAPSTSHSSRSTSLPTPPSTSPPPLALPFLTDIVIALYLAGAVWGLLRHAGLHVALWRLRRQWQPVTGERATWFAALARASGVEPRVPLLAAPFLGNAAAAGTLRPAVVVPAAWLENLARSELEPLLLHELAHLRARDPLMKSLWAVARALCWPHPLVHWLARRDAHLGELVADGRVLERGWPRRDYARLLAQLIEDPPSPRPLAIATGFLGTRGALEGRIRMILDPRLDRPAARWSAALLATVPVVLLGWLLAHPLIGAPDETDASDAVTEDPVRDAAPSRDAPVRFENIDGYWHAIRLDSKGKTVWQLRLCAVRHGWPKVTEVTQQLWKGQVLEQAHIQVGSDDRDETLLFVIDIDNGYVDAMKHVRRSQPAGDEPVVVDLDGDGDVDLYVASGLLGALMTDPGLASDLAARFESVEVLSRTLLQVAQLEGNLRAHKAEVEAAASDLRRRDLQLEIIDNLQKHGATTASELAAANARIADARAVLERRKADLELARLEGALEREEAARAARIGERMRAQRDRAGAREVESLQATVAPFIEAYHELTRRVAAVESELEQMRAQKTAQAGHHTGAARAHASLTDRIKERYPQVWEQITIPKPAPPIDGQVVAVNQETIRRRLREQTEAAAAEQSKRDAWAGQLEARLVDAASSNTELRAQLDTRDARIETLETQLESLQEVVRELQADRRKDPERVR